MSVALAIKYSPKVDELFKAESKLGLLTNTDYDWTGAHTVKVYKMSTVSMNDYDRNRYEPGVGETEPANLSRYGMLYDLNATTEELLLSKDRSFIFNVDKMDTDETAGALEAESALARQLREVVIPEVDTYVYGKMAAGAGGEPEEAEALTKTNVYTAILAGSEYLDDKEIPDTERVLVVSPATYTLLKQAAIFDNTEVGAEQKATGVIAYLDGMAVVKVPAARLPENFAFMIAHPSATVAPVKLEDFGVHSDTVLSSGDIVTGRVVYDAFVLDNKKHGIYYYELPEDDDEGESDGAE